MFVEEWGLAITWSVPGFAAADSSLWILKTREPSSSGNGVHGGTGDPAFDLLAASARAMTFQMIGYFYRRRYAEPPHSTEIRG
jgi:hypothetical protein